MESAAIKLVQALLDEEALLTREHSSAFGETAYWQRVRSLLLSTYHQQCKARGIGPTLYGQAFHELLSELDDAWACLTSPARAVIQQTATSLQSESKLKEKLKAKVMRALNKDDDITSDAAALEKWLDALMPQSLQAVGTRVQRVYLPKEDREFVADRLVRVFLDLQTTRAASME